MFKSYRYHVSEPFEFRPGYTNQRANLTFLFGERSQGIDKYATTDGGVDEPLSNAEEAIEEAWDLF